MSEALGQLLAAISQMMQAADLDHAILANARIDPEWLTDHANQRVVNSFLFNYIKIQDKLGGKLFRLALRHWREEASDGILTACKNCVSLRAWRLGTNPAKFGTP